MITVRFPAMACSHRILAEGASLDRLINFILLVFSATALPGLLGFVVLWWAASVLRRPTSL